MHYCRAYLEEHVIFFCFFFFFFNDTATTEIYTLSLHDALPISLYVVQFGECAQSFEKMRPIKRSEEHTSELQSRSDLVCRLLLEKKKKQNNFAYLHLKKKEKKNRERDEER